MMKLLSLSLILLSIFFLSILASSSGGEPPPSCRNKTRAAKLERSGAGDSDSTVDTTSSCNSPSGNSRKEALIKRLEIYIRSKDISALFCELAANRYAADLIVFEGVFNLLLGILQVRRTAAVNNVDSVASVFRAFINFNVNVAQAKQLKNSPILLDFFIKRFKTLKRPFLAFFVLLQDRLSQHEYEYIFSSENANY